MSLNGEMGLTLYQIVELYVDVGGFEFFICED
jgi:hypothetical protein